MAMASIASSSTAEPNFLYAILNLASNFNEDGHFDKFSWDSFFQIISFYFRSYLNGRFENQLVIYLNLNNCFGLKVFENQSSPMLQDNDSFFGMRDGLTTLLRKDTSTMPSAPAGLSVCLSKILCDHYRLQKIHARLASEILIINQCSLSSARYIPFLNAAFEAQHSRILINAMDLAAMPNTLLRQAASITSGTFVSFKFLNEILPFAFSYSIGDSGRLRPLFNPTLQHDVDFRGACFCHGKSIDIGFVCSVCLSGNKSIVFSMLSFCSSLLRIFAFLQNL